MINVDVTDIVVICILWVLFLPPALFWISGKISLVGVYHKLDEKETFADKIVKILRCNFYLSFPFIYCFTIVIQKTIDGTGIVDAFVLSLPITVASLSTLRILANPSKHIKPKLCDLAEKNDSPIDQHKERMLSFFYSFIGAAIIISFIIMSNDVLLSNVVEPPIFDINLCFSMLVFFAFVLIAATVIGECVLKQFPPIKTI